MDSVGVELNLQFIFGMMGIFALIFVIALLTPHIAKLFTPKNKKPERVDEEIYKVKGPYDGDIKNNDDGDEINGKG